MARYRCIFSTILCHGIYNIYRASACIRDSFNGHHSATRSCDHIFDLFYLTFPFNMIVANLRADIQATYFYYLSGSLVNPGDNSVRAIGSVKEEY